MPKELKTTPKISVKIWKPIIKKLDDKLERACLRRDAYLAKVLTVELRHLDEDVSIPNTQASYDYVFKQLDNFDRKLVSLALPTELTTQLNDICTRKRIVRDALFNRLFLLLAADSSAIDSLLFEAYASEWRKAVWSECKNDREFFQSMFYPLNPDIDPFWAVRCGYDFYNDKSAHEDYIEPTSGNAIRIKRDFTGKPMPIDSLYTTPFSQKVRGNNLAGMNCYLPDWMIPGHDAEQAHQTQLDEILNDLKVLS